MCWLCAECCRNRELALERALVYHHCDRAASPRPVSRRVLPRSHNGAIACRGTGARTLEADERKPVRTCPCAVLSLCNSPLPPARKIAHRQPCADSIHWLREAAAPALRRGDLGVSSVPGRGRRQRRSL